MKTITIIAIIILISGCASQDGRTLKIFGGSPKHGKLAMSLISSRDEAPHINWEKSTQKAKQRCNDWGFDNVITPDPKGANLSCVYMVSGDRCAKFNHLYIYRCFSE
ncbi:MAG: YecR family lipoprotein [Thiotrichaceae bacterium]